ncbi:MAG: pre-peptidase C-terminal domain-containing protein [Burkholderiaceae bacterium]|nr:pre-peptidase C-terminal domain-containing protein [Burkholderiaceae bacterium]
MINNQIEAQSHLKAAPTGPLRRADLIVETDYEFYQKFNNTTTASNYASDLFAYISAKYQQEIGARFLIKQLNIYNTAADPWTQTSTSSMLNELRSNWNATAKASVPRHHVHLLSGKNAGGGVAYLGTLNEPSYAYGVSGNISGAFTPSNPQIVWDAVVVAHEIGHAFGSEHTHAFDNPSIGSKVGGAIDCCYSSTTGQCVTQLGGANKPGVLPGTNATTGGIGGQKNGTIMSYCHTLSPGMGNISFTFGDGHPYGVNPSRVGAVMQTSAQQFLPADTTAPSTTYALTVSKAGTGTSASAGTVDSSPAGISCGADCTENYAANTVVTLTATAPSGSSFTGWGGSCTGTVNTCSVTMAAARSVTANFAAAQTNRLLTLAKAGAGSGTVQSIPSSINCDAACGGASVSFPTTSSVVLSALPATGSSFAGWSGACTGTTTCTVAAGTTSANVTATFNSTVSPTVTLGEATGLSGAAGSANVFTIQVPAGGRNLVIATSGGTGDVDLYVKAGATPTTTSFDCSPYLQGNAEKCTLSAPKAGAYYILLQGAAAYSGVALKATWTAGKAVQTEGAAPGVDSNASAVQSWVAGPAD